MVDFSPAAVSGRGVGGWEVTQPSISLFVLQVLELVDIIPDHGLLNLCFLTLKYVQL